MAEVGGAVTEKMVRQLLLARLRASKSRREFAREMKISEGSLSNMLSGRHGLSRKVLDGLGLVAVVDYRRKSDMAPEASASASPAKRLFRFGDWPVWRT